MTDIIAMSRIEIDLRADAKKARPALREILLSSDETEALSRGVTGTTYCCDVYLSMMVKSYWGVGLSDWLGISDSRHGQRPHSCRC